MNYTLSWDKSDDDNERDPFTFRYARSRRPRRRSTATRTATSATASTRWLLWHAPGKVNVNLRYSYRSAQPLSLSATAPTSQTVFGPTSDRIRADGSIVERNTGRKDNEFSSLDLRVSREFAARQARADRADLRGLQPVQQQELQAPQYQNLVFNFDGTVQSGLGDPRQAQLGVRLIW